MAQFDPHLAHQIYEFSEKIGRQIYATKEKIEKLIKEADKVADLAEYYVLLQNVIENINDANKELNKFKSHVSYDIIPQRFIDERIGKSTTTDSGYKVTVSTSTSAKIKDGVVDRGWLDEHPIISERIKEFLRETNDENFPIQRIAYEWLRSMGHGGVIKETIHHQTLSSVVKSMIEEENVEPPNVLFEVGTTSYTQIRKTK